MDNEEFEAEVIENERPAGEAKVIEGEQPVEEAEQALGHGQVGLANLVHGVSGHIEDALELRVHTGEGEMCIRDRLEAYLDAWREENVDLDGVYSGFLGSAEQVAVIQRRCV